MRNFRCIARLDIKGSNLIKGVRLEGLRIMGDPQAFARRYYEAGADELLYMDTVASLYGRNSLHEILRRAANDIFVPLTVGGGIRTAADVRDILRSGADKIAINTAAVERPNLITEVAERFGSQCVVLSVEAKRVGDRWEAFTNNGRERSGRDVIEWCREGVARGAGEILLTSVDREGTRKGFDEDLIAAVAADLPVPLIASGGMGKLHDAVLASASGADAIAIADLLHYSRNTIAEVKTHAAAAGLNVRLAGSA